jgi:GT2 family glycosyltransferase
MTISVVVVSYRPGAWLGACLASVAGQADQVVLIDNGSEDAVASRIGREAGATVVRCPVNTGFAPAVNLGAGIAKGTVLALLNDDAVAEPAWLPSAERALEDPSIAVVGPKIVLSARFREVVLDDQPWVAPGDGRPLGRQVRSVRVDGIEMLEVASGPGLYRLEHDGDDRWRWTAGPEPWYVPLTGDGEGTKLVINGRPAPPGRVVRLLNGAGTFLDKRGYAGDIGADTTNDGRFDEPGERFAVSGAAFVTRRGTWRRLGPFARRYFAYYEDVDWCWRAHLAGMKVWYDPAGTVVHRRSASSGGEHEPWVRVMAERNRTLSMVRNGPSRLVLDALRQRLSEGPDGGVRAGTAALLPWALATRARLSRQWTVRPEDVWDRWAGWEP